MLNSEAWSSKPGVTAAWAATAPPPGTRPAAPPPRTRLNPQAAPASVRSLLWYSRPNTVMSAHLLMREPGPSPLPGSGVPCGMPRLLLRGRGPGGNGTSAVGAMPEISPGIRSRRGGSDLWTRAKRSAILGKVPRAGRWCKGLADVTRVSSTRRWGYEKTRQVLDVCRRVGRCGDRACRGNQRHRVAGRDAHDARGSRQAHAHRLLDGGVHVHRGRELRQRIRPL